MWAAALLLLAVFAVGSFALGPTFYGANSRKQVTPSPETMLRARRLWNEYQTRGGLSSGIRSSPMSEEDCDLAFCSLTQCLQSEHRALLVAATHPPVLALRPAHLRDSFSAWCTRLQDEKAAKGLVARTPRVLERTAASVAATDENSVLFTLILSYAAAIGREVLRRLSRA